MSNPPPRPRLVEVEATYTFDVPPNLLTITGLLNQLQDADFIPTIVVRIEYTSSSGPMVVRLRKELP